jgi:hypothetical protein
MIIKSLLFGFLISAAMTTPALAQGVQGVINPYTCNTTPGGSGIDQSSFIGHHHHNTFDSVVANHDAGGAVWTGLNTPFKSISFDVQGPSCKTNSNCCLPGAVFYANVVLTGTDLNGVNVPDNLEFYVCQNFTSAQPLPGGFTRYTIDTSALSLNDLHPPAIINRIVFIQYGPINGVPQKLLIGNFILNGNISPIINMQPVACPPVVDGGL